MRALRVMVATIAVLLLAACGGSDAEMAAESADSGVTTTDRSAAGGGEEAADAAPLAAAKEYSADADGLATSKSAVGSGGAADTGGEIEAPELEPLPPAAARNDRIIKEGTISIEVADGKFDASFQQVISKARALGGDVVGSSTRTTDDGDTFGSVTVRVPVADFEDLLVDMGGIGTVRNRDIQSQDVTAEYTDLESRLRHLEALERFYLGLFKEAEDVQDAITVQQKLGDVQAQIEKAKGRLNLLDDRTSFSTLTIEIFEPGSSAVIQEDEPNDRPTFARYWETARDAFVNVVGAMLVALFFLLPLLVPLAFVALVGTTLWRNRRRAVAPAGADAPAQEEREPAASA